MYKNKNIINAGTKKVRLHQQKSSFCVYSEVSVEDKLSLPYYLKHAGWQRMRLEGRRVAPVVH